MKLIKISAKLFFAGGLGLLLLKLLYAISFQFADSAGLPKEMTFIFVSALIALFLITISVIYKAPTLSNLQAENAILSEKYSELASENEYLASDLNDCQKQNELWASEFKKANDYAKAKHNEVIVLEKQTASELKQMQLDLAAARENNRAANAKISDFTKEKSELMQTLSKLQASNDFVNLVKSKYAFILELEKANTIEDKEAALENLKSFGRSLINSINGAKKGKKAKEYETV